MGDLEGKRRSTLVRCPKHGRIYDSAKTTCPGCIAESRGTSPPPPQPPPKQGLPRPAIAGILGIIVLTIAGPKLLRVVTDAFRSKGPSAQGGAGSAGRARGVFRDPIANRLLAGDSLPHVSRRPRVDLSRTYSFLGDSSVRAPGNRLIRTPGQGNGVDLSSPFELTDSRDENVRRLRIFADILNRSFPQKLDAVTMMLRIDITNSGIVNRAKITSLTSAEVLQARIMDQVRPSLVQNTCSIRAYKMAMERGFSVSYSYVDRDEFPAGTVTVTKADCDRN